MKSQMFPSSFIRCILSVASRSLLLNDRQCISCPSIRTYSGKTQGVFVFCARLSIFRLSISSIPPPPPSPLACLTDSSVSKTSDAFGKLRFAALGVRILRALILVDGILSFAQKLHQAPTKGCDEIRHAETSEDMVIDARLTPRGPARKCAEMPFAILFRGILLGDIAG